MMHSEKFTDNKNDINDSSSIKNARKRPATVNEDNPNNVS
jgi:hypothetical protein